MSRIFNLIALLLSFVLIVNAQADSGAKQFTFAGADTYINDISGDGRFVVFESRGNLATFNARNVDGNNEIFLLDVAQRHIFQITDTKHALLNPNGSTTENANIRIYIFNTRPSISNDGRWIAFSSNATTSIFPGDPNGTNPGNFNGNTSGYLQILQQDANTELWLYQLPGYANVDLSLGDLPAFADLGAGIFVQATNTPPSQLPRPGAQNLPPVVADDNHDPCLNDDGSTIAFSSTRDLVPPGNSYPVADNQEIFIYKRLLQVPISQITTTSRGAPANPIYNTYPVISGNGMRVAFMSNGMNPITGMIGGNNNDFNLEVHFADLNSAGAPAPFGTKRQVTETVPPFVGDPVNIWTLGRRMSRDGRFFVFDSYGDLATENGGTVYDSLATYLYDAESTPSSAFRRIGPRSNADGVITGGDPTFRYPIFSDYNSNSTIPTSVIFSTRVNFRADGTVPPVGSNEGLNPAPFRPTQYYYYNFSNSTPTFTRVSSSPSMDAMINGRCFPANSSRRTACTFVDQMFLKTGYYFLNPSITQLDDSSTLQFFTGASGLALNSSPPQALGFAPNMLGSLTYTSLLTQSVSGFATQVSNSRNFAAPLQLKGVSVTINGYAAYVTGVTQGKVNFIVPAGLTAGNKTVVVNHNGIALRGTVNIVSSAQPDIVTTRTLGGTFPAPNGRAYVLNVTNPSSPTSEPFRVTTQTPSGSAPTKLRIFLTGVDGVSAENINIRIGNVNIPAASVLTAATPTDYPGVFTFDFEMPQQLDGAGNVPVVVSVGTAQSQPDATAARINIMPVQSVPGDVAVWRPSAGTWYVLGGPGSLQTYYNWGLSGDIPVPGDYDGDDKTDFSVFRPSSGTWYIAYSSSLTGGWGAVNFGAACIPPQNNCDMVAPADYDGDGKTDVAVWRPTDRIWYIIRSSDQGISYIQYGLSTDIPAPADYDGDGRADVAVWRNSDNTLYTLQSSYNESIGIPVGQSGDQHQPVSADYDGDGKADAAVWRPSNGTWIIRQSSNNQETTFAYGLSTDKPVQNDYDGDGKCDIAIFRPLVSAQWWIRKSSTNTDRVEIWGTNGDIPVPAFYRRQ